MKFRFLFAGVSAVALASTAALVTACSSDDPAPATSTGGAAIPGPAGSATTSTTRQVFAASKVFLGDTDRSGTPSDVAWKKYGYDLDGKKTTSKSKDACLPSAGGPPIPDGDNGVDNSFGANVLGVLKNALPTPTPTTQNSINDGAFTLLFDLTGLSAEAKQSNTGLSGQVLVPGPFPENTKPNWADPANIEFAVRSNLVDGNDPTKSKIKFSEVYVNEGLLVAKSPSIDLTLAFGGVNAVLSIKNAVVTANHSSADKLTGGTIVGVLKLADLQQLITDIGPRLTDQLCPGSQTLKTALDALAQYGDIMVAGANGPGTCDGISIALGFEAVQVKAPTKLYTPEAVTEEGDKCSPADAGKDASTTADAGADAK